MLTEAQEMKIWNKIYVISFLVFILSLILIVLNINFITSMFSFVLLIDSLYLVAIIKCKCLDKVSNQS